MEELILIFGRAYCFTIGGKADRKINKVSPNESVIVLYGMIKGYANDTTTATSPERSYPRSREHSIRWAMIFM